MENSIRRMFQLETIPFVLVSAVTNATVLADASSGELRALAERQCDINPFGKSIAYNRYDGGFSFIYIALTAITITVLIL